MKKIFAFIAICCSLAGYSQMKEGRVVYERTFQLPQRIFANNPDLAARLPRSRTDQYELLFGNNQSLWQFLPDANSEGDGNTFGGGGMVFRFAGGGNDISGAIAAEAGSGDIRLETKGAGDVHVRTGSGDIQLRGISGGLWVEAGSGDVSAEGTQTNAWEVRTGSGNVDLELPDNAGFDLQASTGSGRVVVDRPLTMTVQGDLEKSHRSMNGQVGGGGPKLMVHTGSGDVSIH
jgi:hypothetical protein